MNSYTWKIGGEAGFGIMTTGLIFSKIATRYGYNIFDYVEYPSLIRGGHNAYEVNFSEDEVTCLKKNIDCLVCLNQDTYEIHQPRLLTDAIIIYDEEEFKIDKNFVKISVPFKKTLNDLQGQQIMKNTIALGSSLAILGAQLDELNKIIETEFQDKGQVVIDFNKKFAQAGFNHVVKNYPDLIKNILSKKQAPASMLMTGNDAFSLGAVIGDCRLYAAYPMTPSSSVLTTLAGWQKESRMVVRHSEDEIAVINTAIGASFVGVRSAVGTSGGGFALMVETVSLAGITETPIVIFLSQRPGPATGMPTWTEQGDLLFAINAGHGEFPKIIIAPGDIEEMIRLTAGAFNLADIYQTPVIVMSDMYLSESHKNISIDSVRKIIDEYKVERGKTISSYLGDKYLRYKITDDGISERLIPGQKGIFYQANSYEHFEDGHTTESANERQAQVEKRDKKVKTYLQSHFRLPTVYGDKDAQIVFVSWGSHKGPIRQAQKILKEKNIGSSLIHFNYIYPIDPEKIKALFQANKRYILVENNFQGQLGKLLRQEAGIEFKEKILKYDGRPIQAEDIVNKLL